VRRSYKQKAGQNTLSGEQNDKNIVIGAEQWFDDYDT
jgi:hypothetical protein